MPGLKPDTHHGAHLPQGLTMTRTLAVAACLATVLGSGLAAATLQISSSAFPANGAIPAKYTCDGQGVNPPLAFAGIPAKTESLVLIVDDPDVPKDLVPSGVFDHWLIWDIPATSKGFAEGEGKGGINGAGQKGFMGPCPPDREHRYFFKLYALDTKLTGLNIANQQALETAMKEHIIERAELVGRYARSAK
jgi:Raf kinase inhibitor-like YbhB/YbcL family protein